jgi:hypothetical protein
MSSHLILKVTETLLLEVLLPTLKTEERQVPLLLFNFNVLMVLRHDETILHSITTRTRIEIGPKSLPSQPIKT